MIPRHLQITLVILLMAAVAGGIYIRHLQKAEERRERQAASVPITAPSTATEKVTMVIAYDNDAVLREQSFNLALPPEPTERARELLRALLAEYQRDPSPHPLPAGAEIRDVYLIADGDSGKSIAVIDSNGTLADAHRSGVLVENLTVGSIVATLHRNLANVAKVKFLVDGQERATLAGHADLTVLYSPETVPALVREVR